MSLAERCKRSFDSNARSRGRRFFQQQRIRIVHQGELTLLAAVDGNSDDYRVKLDWSEVPDSDMETHCTCPRFDSGYLCKHIWATLLEMEAKGIGQRAPGTSAVGVAEPDEETFADEYPGYSNQYAGDRDESVDRFDPSTRQRNGHRHADVSTSRHKPTWHQVLRTVRSQQDDSGVAPADLWEELAPRRREVWYVLSAGRSINEESLVVEFFQRETKKGGEWGKTKAFNIHRHQFDAIQDPVDRQLIEMMLGNTAGTDSYYSSYTFGFTTYSHCTISPAMYEILLPKLCATGRFVWMLDSSLPMGEGQTLAWDKGQPWRFGLVVETDKKQNRWKMRGQFSRGNETVSVEEAVFSAHGLVLFRNRLARLAESGVDGWTASFHRAATVEIPFADREKLINQLWSMQHVPDMQLPIDLRVDEVHVPPQGRLSIKTAEGNRANSKQMRATISFLYGEHACTVDDQRRGFYVAEQNCVSLREADGERQLLAALKDFPLRPVQPHLADEAHVQFHQKHFMDIVQRLTAAGWYVESEGVQFRQPGTFDLRVTSDVDWFELHGEVDFEGVSVPLPTLLAAMRDGNSYIQLDDGSQGMLPEKWLQRYGRLAELAETNSAALRFRSSQALFLDALLAEQENVQVDRMFDGIRKKLRSFSGVKPCEPPRGFQGKLRKYQREGLGWLHFIRQFGFGGCLADDMGLGKTVQVLALLLARRQRRVKKGESKSPSIVVVPKSLVFNWIDEAQRFTPKLRVLNYTGTDRAERLDAVDDYDVLLTTYGTLRRDIAELKDMAFDYAILDESQAIKNSNSQAAKACRLLQADHRLAMTGTPVENHVGELWSLFEFLNPGMLGRSSAFAAMAHRGQPNDLESLQLLSHALRPFVLRRTKDKVLKELPAKTEQTLYCEMAPKQRKQYDELREYYRAQLSKNIAEEGLQKSKFHVLEALLRLRQAACHPGLLDAKHETEPSAKLETLLRQLDEVLDEGHKALVFSQFTSLLTIVRKQLDHRNVNYEYLDGRTRKRGEKVKRFQEDPDCRLFLISLKAGGHGLNLTAADYVFILDPWWNPAVEAQAVDRTHRIGQKRRVFAYRLICGDTVEEKILQLQGDKRELADAIISTDKSVLRDLTADDLQLLLS
tara:strand:- start:1077 stop:4454 length:3378 start_codon:yes stop_codon:yes gene_type:complete